MELDRRTLLKIALLEVVQKACGPIATTIPNPSSLPDSRLAVPTTTPAFSPPTIDSTPIPIFSPTSSPVPQPTLMPKTDQPRTQEPVKQETPQQKINVISRGNPNRPELCLTFDAGAGATYTSAILDILKRKNIKSTMFLTGLWMLQNQDLVKRIVSEGHEFWNHSYDHRDFRNLSPQEIIEQLKMTEDISLRLTGRSTKPIFRPPYGGYDSRVLGIVASQGYTNFVYWTFDTIDWDYDNMNPEGSAKRVFYDNGRERQNLTGAIVLMHLDSKFEPQTLSDTIDGLRKKGLNPTTLTNILRN